MKRIRKELQSIEEQFFVMENDIARIRRHARCPEEFFDTEAETKIPRLNSDFTEWMTEAFEYVPDRHKLDFEILLDDRGGYTEAELEEIFRKNILLELKMNGRVMKRERRLVLSLCAAGTMMILLYVGLDMLWKSEGMARDLVFFILDIMATVPFWGAMDICFVEKRKRRQRMANYLRRFHAIRFPVREAE